MSVNKNIDARLQQIANVLLLNASFIDNIGLLNGKMGIAIFFFQYGRYCNNKIYTDYAGELIDEIYEETSIRTPIDFANGLTGIGWAIEYLVKNKFIDADTNEALSEIDDAVYSRMPDSPLLIDKEDCFFSYGLYCISRYQGHENSDDNYTLIKKEHLLFLIDECERLFVKKDNPKFENNQINHSKFNSLLWFLLEAYRISLAPSKVEKVLMCLPDYSLDKQDKSVNYVDLSVIHNLSHNAFMKLKDKKIKDQYIELTNRISGELNKLSTIGELPLSQIQLKNFLKLIYNPYIKDTISDIRIYGQVFETIGNEQYWNNALDKLKGSDFGLSGLAGVGSLLINSINLDMKQDFQEMISDNSLTC